MSKHEFHVPANRARRAVWEEPKFFTFRAALEYAISCYLNGYRVAWVCHGGRTITNRLTVAGLAARRRRQGWGE
jgi:hypothetical protein